ncbi:substrate-binding periplasmic protein [Catenulispora rubra]|uniref:substrate-binding periplasmic protein n=1 Tax=Catenulispora rubra TaxID=280293 RepID=UPI00189238AD|nr:ABC transporter substrate-binding protein [Catenulispora rubra]
MRTESRFADSSALRLLQVDCPDALPIRARNDQGGLDGYEPAVATLVGEVLGREVVWVDCRWDELHSSLEAGNGDAIWIAQAITEERQKIVDFSRPYGAFGECVLARAGSGITSPADLAGRRIAALGNSTNLAVAETFADVEIVVFDGSRSMDVFADLLAAVRTGEVDAMVDDDVVCFPVVENDPALELAFLVPTRHEWAASVSKRRPDVREAIDHAIATISADGRLRSTWERWIPTLPYPFEEKTAA